MIRFILRRLGWSVVVLWLVATVTFFGSLRVGDPVAMIAGPHASARDRDYIRRFYHLDRPPVEQYARYMGNLPAGDLGRSFRYRQPVATLIAVRLPRTLLLGVMVIAFELFFGILAGPSRRCAAARAPSRWCWAPPSWASPRPPSSRASSSC